MNTLEIIAELKKHHVVPRLEGQQLKLTGETRNLSAAHLEQIRAGKEGLIAFLRNSMEQLAFAPIPPAPPQPWYPATNAQQRLWVLSQFEGGAAAYNIIKDFYLRGPLIPAYLEAALREAIRRHESLRTVFAEIEGAPRQVVRDEVPFALEFEDLGGTADARGRLRAEVADAGHWRFGLSVGPLIRVKLFRLADDAHALLFGIHHLVSDGWSMGVLIGEVMNHYRSLCQGEATSAPPLPVQYKDYAHWLAERIAGPRGQAAREFWRAEFAESPEPLDLPTDFPRPAVRSFDGAVYKHHFDPQAYAALLGFCREHQVTPFNFFRATLHLLLHKWSGQHDTVIGTPVSGRTHFDLEQQIGLYVNTLPLRSRTDPESTFLAYLKGVSDHSLRAFEHQDYPLDAILGELDLKRDTSRNPLFDVMMVLQNTAVGDRLGSMGRHYGIRMELLENYLDAAPAGVKAIPAKFDLNFNFDTGPDGRFFVEIEYATSLFGQESIQQLLRAYCALIDQVTAAPQTLLRALQITDEAEKQRILHRFNAPIGEIAEPSLLALLEEPFRQYAGRPALLAGDVALTYADLDTLSGRVAGRLVAEMAADPQPFVGLLVDRSEWMLISILGILRAGAAYVPVDPTYPAARIGFMLADARPGLLIVDDAGLPLVPEAFPGRVLHLRDLQNSPLVAVAGPAGDRREQPAYLVYTSGSTGTPKGVQICHRNAIAFLKWSLEEFAGTDFRTLYAATSYCFDLSVFEFFYPLLAGKTIRLLGSALQIPGYLAADGGVMLNTVPSVVRSLLEGDTHWAAVTALNMAGEPVPARFKAEPVFAGIEVRNLYGPSEDTTYSTVYRFADDGHRTVPIGKPVGYTQLYILDEHGNLLPPGVNGEICLSGQSVAQGYLNQPELTAAKFVPNPFVPGAVMYRTGDWGRWLPDGNVAFAGRRDDQAKIRGYRVEPGEVQCLLEQHPLVHQAVVLVKRVGEENQLVAYWAGPATWPLLRDYLAEKVPAYLVPAYGMALPHVPLNANGKVDKRQLPDPVAGGAPDAPRVAPRSFTEHRLLPLWQEVLGVEALGVTHNFFEAGGHSLKATRLRALVAKTLEKELTLNEIFTYPTVEKQARLLEARARRPGDPIPATARRDWYPISFAQERLWGLTRFENASGAYHMPAAFRVHGALDVQRLETALHEVIERHESLRTVFAEQEGRPVQVVLDAARAACPIEEVWPAQAFTEDEETAFLRAQWQAPFDLARGPLLRCQVLHAGRGPLLCFNMHHLVSDGWSVGVLYREVMAAYGRPDGGVKTAPPPALQYRDYAAWQRERLTGPRLLAHQAYWHDQFADGIPVLELPTDFARPAVKTYAGDTLPFRFGPEATAQLYGLARQAGVSLFATLLTGVAVLLKKYANQNDVVIGTPVAGRDHPQLADQIGFYVNTLPVRTRMDGAETFRSLLVREAAALLEAFEHQEYPFEMLVEALQPKRNPSRSPLFDAMVVLQQPEGWLAGPAGPTGGPGALPTLERVVVPAGTAKYDLTFTFTEEDGGLTLELEYNTGLFRPGTIERLGKHLERLLATVAAAPETPVKDISLLDPAEYAVLFSKADQTRTRYDEAATLVSLFARAAARYPDQTAVSAPGGTLTYRELDRQSGQLAHLLLDTYGVQPEELVVLHFERNAWMLVGILAVLKAGAAYVPVEPSYPAARTGYILEDTGSRLLLCDQAPAALPEAWPRTAVVEIATLPYDGPVAQAAVAPGHLAYVIYTSGTTGNPKGVLIEHRHVVRLLCNDDDLFDFGPGDKWSLFHSYCFDFSVWEMYGALLKGGQLVVVPREVAQDSLAFHDFLVRQQITVLNQTPTAFRSLVQHNRQRFAAAPLAVRYLIFGGEALRPEILRDWHGAFPACRNVNMYGITETTVHVTYKEITGEEISANRSNVGLPIPTLSCFVLDADLQPVPVGVTGELCVGGAGVARGYLNQPGLTAEKFIDHPLRPGQRLYRSGDYARVLPSGDIEYIGRKDQQVKIRGHRIETTEIEGAIAGLPGVKDVVVLPVKAAGDDYDLAAYFIAGPEVSGRDLRHQLRERLPAYMVPAYFIALPAFPLNRNGKLDRQALPRPVEVSTAPAHYVPARNDIDRQLVAVWEEVLERNPVGIRDNFFDLGGHSLKATQVISRIQELYGIRIDLKDLFTDPTIEHLTRYIETVQWTDRRGEAVPEGGDELIF